MVTLVRTASHDPLTGCFTRRTGTELLELQFRVAARHGNPICVLFIDVDHFKSVNDDYGHEAGDDLLRDLATRLRAGVRQADSVIRWGGEEFVLLLANADLNGAETLIQRMVQDGFGSRLDGHPVSVSIGAAERIADQIADWPQLIELADRRMYAAKQSGRHSYALSDAAPADYLPLSGNAGDLEPAAGA